MGQPASRLLPEDLLSVTLGSAMGLGSLATRPAGDWRRAGWDEGVDLDHGVCKVTRVGLHGDEMRWPRTQTRHRQWETVLFDSSYSLRDA